MGNYWSSIHIEEYINDDNEEFNDIEGGKNWEYYFNKNRFIEISPKLYNEPS